MNSPSLIVESPYFTARQAAAWLNVSLAAVRKWRRLGSFPEPKYFGRSLRWHKEVIEKWAESRKK